MYNPLVRFSEKMIPGFLAMKARYLVAQTYIRGSNTLTATPCQPLLLSDYHEAEKAQAHYDHIRLTDHWAALIDLEQDTQQQELLRMSAADAPYLLYVAFIADAAKVNTRNNEQLKEAARQYINRSTDWRPGRNDTVQANLELTFGELFITFRHGKDKISITLDTLEKLIATCATTFHSLPVSERYRITFPTSVLIRS